MASMANRLIGYHVYTHWLHTHLGENRSCLVIITFGPKAHHQVLNLQCACVHVRTCMCACTHAVRTHVCAGACACAGCGVATRMPRACDLGELSNWPDDRTCHKPIRPRYTPTDAWHPCMCAGEYASTMCMCTYADASVHGLKNANEQDCAQKRLSRSTRWHGLCHQGGPLPKSVQHPQSASA